ncbi:MAG: N-acetylmuramic acid 6-phosphate etherase [Candidatus Thermoplasmatota archaeon]|nr:N-acetylmuramic acid 6-phosphate etherase [Candidatus Thermoplasmatota archaeon]
MDTVKLLHIINKEDKIVPEVVEKSIPEIIGIVEEATKQISKGGRMIYVGAGTAGRLGVLDAAECVPTFGASPETVIAVIAGGYNSISHPTEGAEDSFSSGEAEMDRIAVGRDDIVIGIVASGRAPYVMGALKRAGELKAVTAAIVNVSNPAVRKYCDHLVTLLVGPEVIAGSSRMKAGTSEKLVLNMISTAVFVKLGKVYDNLMIDIRPVNEKLKERMVNIVRKITDVNRDSALSALIEADWNIKAAIIMVLNPMSLENAKNILALCNGNLRCALSKFKK